MAAVAMPSFEIPAVQAALKQAFAPPTFKIHVVSAEEALLLKLPEYERDDDCWCCFGFKEPAARTFAELAPGTARHQWTLGIDGNTLTCVQKCGQDRFDAARDGVDLELESVMQRLPHAVNVLMSNRWFVNGQIAAPLQAIMPMQAVTDVQKKATGSQLSFSSTCAPSSQAPTSMLSRSESIASGCGDAPAQQSMPQVASTGVTVADEIRKLAELMREGILTDEEFQVQKKRLLSEPLIG